MFRQPLTCCEATSTTIIKVFADEGREFCVLIWQCLCRDNCKERLQEHLVATADTDTSIKLEGLIYDWFPFPEDDIPQDKTMMSSGENPGNRPSGY